MIVLNLRKKRQDRIMFLMACMNAPLGVRRPTKPIKAELETLLEKEFGEVRTVPIPPRD